MMGMGGNSKKGLASVLLNSKGEAVPYSDDPEEPARINPEQGLIDASKELIKAIEGKDAERVARCFKAMMNYCSDEMSEEE